jgi:hypothetical protein
VSTACGFEIVACMGSTAPAGGLRTRRVAHNADAASGSGSSVEETTTETTAGACATFFTMSTTGEIDEPQSVEEAVALGGADAGPLFLCYATNCLSEDNDDRDNNRDDDWFGGFDDDYWVPPTCEEEFSNNCNSTWYGDSQVETCNADEQCRGFAEVAPEADDATVLSMIEDSLPFGALLSCAEEANGDDYYTSFFSTRMSGGCKIHTNHVLQRNLTDPMKLALAEQACKATYDSACVTSPEYFGQSPAERCEKDEACFGHLRAATSADKAATIKHLQSSIKFAELAACSTDLQQCLNNPLFGRALSEDELSAIDTVVCNAEYEDTCNHGRLDCHDYIGDDDGYDYSYDDLAADFYKDKLGNISGSGNAAWKEWREEYAEMTEEEQRAHLTNNLGCTDIRHSPAGECRADEKCASLLKAPSTAAADETELITIFESSKLFANLAECSEDARGYGSFCSGRNNFAVGREMTRKETQRLYSAIGQHVDNDKSLTNWAKECQAEVEIVEKKEWLDTNCEPACEEAQKMGPITDCSKVYANIVFSFRHFGATLIDYIQRHALHHAHHVRSRTH